MEAVDRIRGLYAIERWAMEAALEPAGVGELRQGESLPGLGRLRAWRSLVRTGVLEKGAPAEEIDCALSSWATLVRCCEDGRLDID